MKKQPKKDSTAKRLLFFNPSKVVEDLSKVLATDLGAKHEYLAPWQHFYCAVQLDELTKKYVDKSAQESLNDVTYKKFLVNRDRMEGLSLPLPKVRPTRNSDFLSKVLWRAKGICAYVLGSVIEDDFFPLCKHSNGASVGVAFRDTSMEAKWTYPITVTPRCQILFERYLLWNTTLRQHLQSDAGNRIIVVKGSVATTVPKTSKINRFIAKEPTANMFLQQGLMGLMVQRLAQVGLRLDTLPEKHRELARLGSMTNGLATIDWSMASDCVHYGLVQFLFPDSWFRMLDRVRSPVCKIAGFYKNLPMISSMGNATTFPIETLVFWSIALGVIFTIDNPDSNSMVPDVSLFEKASVYGDDCVLPSQYSARFIEVCTSIGFICNQQKSFTDDLGFRESCGGDYFRGVDVRPFHLKSPTSVGPSGLEAWLYTIANSVLKKYIQYFGRLSYVYDKAFFNWWFSLFRATNTRVKVVPDYFPDDAGLKIFSDFARFLVNYDWQVMPIRVSQHGTVSFNYLRKIYSGEMDTDSGLRYANRLQTISYRRSSPLPHFEDPSKEVSRYDRDIGGYVVARASTCFLEF